ncbi:MAG: MFS transporter [Candidatus Dormibacteria bacterium]
MTVAAPAASPDQHEADPRRWIALAVVLMASFMILLDISIVNVAIPRIQADLSASFAQIQFVIAGYQLAYAVCLITGGRLGDVFGRKLMFMTGVAGFTIASALCGFAPSAGTLVGARVLQGLMAALMYPQVLSVIQVSFPPRQRAAAFGVFGGVVGLATISGPLLGGLLIEADVLSLGWRPIFLVNVPIGIGAIVAAAVFLRESRSPAAPRLDLPGVALASTGLFLLAYPLVEGRDLGWPRWVYLSLMAAALVLVVFTLYERRRSAGQGSPLLDLALFRDRPFVVGSLLAFVFFAGIPAFFLTFSLFLQIGLDFTALQAGLATLPFALGSGLASGVSIRLAPRVGKRILQFGAVALVIGLLASLAVVRAEGTGLRGYQLIPSLLVTGVGLGLIVAPLITIILAGIDRSKAGSASGVLTTMQQIGGALGVAIIGIIFFGALAGHADTSSGELSVELRQRLAAARVEPHLVDSAMASFTRCFRERSAASDPTATPHGCPAATPAVRCDPAPQGPPAVPCITRLAATKARGDNFSHAFQGAILYEIALFVLTFFLVFLLPRSPATPRTARPGAPAAAPASSELRPS